METLYTCFRFVHILAGTIAFVVAPVVLMVKKGGHAHMLWGKVFFWSMVAVAFSAVLMTTYHPNLFLFFVASFSFHLSLYGYRAICRNKSSNRLWEKCIDKIITAVACLAYVGLILCGLRIILSPGEQAFGYISVAFGVIGLRFSIQEIKHLQKSSPGKMEWLFRHMQGMIATLSAFSAVNLLFLPTVIRWLWPTIIGSTLLYFWENHYRKKFTRVPVQEKKQM